MDHANEEPPFVGGNGEVAVDKEEQLEVNEKDDIKNTTIIIIKSNKNNRARSSEKIISSADNSTNDIDASNVQLSGMFQPHHFDVSQ